MGKSFIEQYNENVAGPLIAATLPLLVCLGVAIGGKAFVDNIKKNTGGRSLVSEKVPLVRTQDINGDGLEDVVVEYNSGKQDVYYNTGEGYQTIEQIRVGEIKRIEDGYREQLRESNDFFKRTYGEPNGVGGEE